MGAYAEQAFNKKGYILDEERLRKINSLLCQRVKDIPNSPIPVYRVFRSDSFTYSTKNLEDIICEDNYDYQRIERIYIYHDSEKAASPYEADEGFHLLIALEKDEIYLKIRGENRDLVFLLLSELKQYISQKLL
jgi:hypothetical protein